ncbi:hypothetical protein TUM4433_34120 [Shewanella schlegeliana]|uniref:AlpA family transcriptional regulator n=1 Tax=Shewanella schlegeliana TaxID=190308 RepID=A0ABS1SSM5_9GAMM|nr:MULTISPECIES: AlpA family transcriptional regulator [Shewanella]MBL4911546.1 AlpA family transcriptional regulator [Shewanella schlegeliana]GIU35995.1 hypothetical protein TUM4433_34120 [Shewanella schlegeliana]
MKKSEYEIISNQLSHIKSTTEGAIRALELNLKYINTIEAQLKTSINEKAVIATLTQASLCPPDPKKQPNDLIKIKEVIQMTSLSRSTIYTKMNQQDFPKSISLSSRSVVWVRKELEDWIQNKMAERLND